jgi:hypothetical protein
MLKHALIASGAVAALLIFSAPAFAASTESDVTINGTVDAVCDISALAGPIALGDIPLTNGIVTAGTTAVGSAGTAYCNGGHNVFTVTANVLTTSGTAPTGIANTINYTYFADLVPGGVISGGAPVTATTPAFAFAADPGHEHVTLTAGTQIQLAGTYTGTVVITVVPGL